MRKLEEMQEQGIGKVMEEVIKGMWERIRGEVRPFDEEAMGLEGEKAKLTEAHDLEQRRLVAKIEGMAEEIRASDAKGKFEDADRKKEQKGILESDLAKAEEDFAGKVASIDKRLREIQGEKRAMVNKMSMESYLQLREDWYGRLFEACAMSEAILSFLHDLARQTSVELPVDHFAVGLLITDHDPSMRWNGNAVLFNRLREAGLML